MLERLLKAVSDLAVKIYAPLLHDNVPFKDKESAQSPNDEYERREITYSAIITQYQQNQSRNLTQNRWFKGIMFAVCIIILIVMTGGWAYIAYLIFARRMSDNFFETLAAVLTSKIDIALLATAVVPVITAYITLPNTIAKYLFAHSDEDAMTKILTALLQHDKATNQLIKSTESPQNSHEENDEDDDSSKQSA